MPPRAHLVGLIACACLVAGAGCGSDDEPEGKPLPPRAASELARRLDEVQRRFDAASEAGKAGACGDIDDDSYPAIDRIVDSLPADVDRDVRAALEASLERLRELTRDGCSNVEETNTEEAPAPPVTTPPPAPVQPQTTPEPTDTEQQPQEKPKKEKQDDDQEQEQEEGGGGLGPTGQGPPGQDGGGQPAPAPGDG